MSPEDACLIHNADKQLKAQWADRFALLPNEAKSALRDALLALRADALSRAQFQWKRHKAPMALYWKVVGVYAGHLARSLIAANPSDGTRGER